MTFRARVRVTDRKSSVMVRVKDIRRAVRARVRVRARVTDRRTALRIRVMVMVSFIEEQQ